MNKAKSVTLRHSLLLVLAAVIWGVAFVAQREGGDATGPYTFNFLRSVIGSAVLLPVIKILDKTKLNNKKPQTKEDKKQLLLGGLCCGICLSAASLLQQVGLYLGTPAGKAGFLTACYIVLVPIFGIFLKRRCGVNVWIAVAITVAGLYLLCIRGGFTIEHSDVLVLLSALVYALHILSVDHFTNRNVDGLRMCSLQFLMAGVVSAVPMFFSEMHGNFSEVLPVLANAFGKEALVPLLYTAVMSSGVAYTLQIVGQRDVNPTVASLLMSMESVFSALAGWLILGETLTLREMGGCALIFFAILLAQLPAGKNKHHSNKRIENKEKAA